MGGVPATHAPAAPAVLTWDDWAAASVPAAVCRLLEALQVCRPADEAAKIASAKHWAARTGVQAFARGADERLALLGGLLTAAIWPARAEPGTLVAARVAEGRTGDRAFLTSVAERAEHGFRVLERWNDEAALASCTRTSAKAAIAQDREHLRVALELMGTGTLGASDRPWRAVAGPRAVGTDAPAPSTRPRPMGILKVIPNVTAAPSGIPLAAARLAACQVAAALGYEGTRAANVALHLLLPARRVPMEASDEGYRTSAVDRVDVAQRLLAALALPQTTALLVPADALLGEVVRDPAWVRGLAARMGSADGAGRRAAAVALGLLGDFGPSDHHLLDLTRALDMEAACLGTVLTAMLPPMAGRRGGTPRGGTPRAASDGEPQWAQDWPSCLRTIAGLEQYALEASDGTASLGVVARAERKIRDGRWFEAVER